MKIGKQEGCGNDGLWKTRKTKSRFPTFPTALGNRLAIPTFPQPRWLEQWKSKTRIPTAPTRFLLSKHEKTTKQGGMPLNADSVAVQAHSTIGKC